MKQILKNVTIAFFSVTLLYFYPTPIKAQTSNKVIRKFYLQSGGGPSTYQGSMGDIALKVVIKNNWCATASYSSFDMKPKNEPPDYIPETGIVLFFPYTYEVRSQVDIFSLTAGKYFPLGKKCWITTEAGLSYVSGDKVNYEHTGSQSSDPLTLLLGVAYTTSNYKTNVNQVSSIGGTLRADFNWAFASFMGLGAGVFTNINTVQSPIGAQLTLSIGMMGREPKAKKRK